MPFSSRPALDADVLAAQALIDAANAALMADCGMDADDPSLLRPALVGDSVVVRHNVTWYGVCDMSAMCWMGWVAASDSAPYGITLTDLDVRDAAYSPTDF